MSEYGERIAELLQKYLPDKTEDEAYRVLMGNTSYPFREPEHIELCLQHYLSDGPGWYGEQFDRDFDDFKWWRDYEQWLWPEGIRR